MPINRLVLSMVALVLVGCDPPPPTRCDDWRMISLSIQGPAGDWRDETMRVCVYSERKIARPQ